METWISIVLRDSGTFDYCSSTKTCNSTESLTFNRGWSVHAKVNSEYLFRDSKEAPYELPSCVGTTLSELSVMPTVSNFAYQLSSGGWKSF